MEIIRDALCLIGLCGFLIWITGKTISEFKKGRATVTQIFQAMLADFMYFTMFFSWLIVPDLPFIWWVITLIICILLYFISEVAGDWIGEIYRKIIKPYKKIYFTSGIIFLVAIVIGSYVLAFTTWKGITHPGILLSVISSAIIAIIGLVIDIFGYSNGIWLLFIKDRDEQERNLVTIVSFFLVWILIGSFIGFFFHASMIKCAVFGIVILMYFMIPAWVGSYLGIIGGLLPSAIHIISFLCVGALVLPFIVI